MFSFFHRTPEIHLDCFTNDVNVYLNTPIINAIKSIPEWCKKISKSKPIFKKKNNDYNFIHNVTVKDCHSLIELYKKGIIIENWSDISIKSNLSGYNYYYSSGLKPHEHPRYQIGEAFPDYHNIKIMSPWIFLEKTGVKFLWFGAEWSLDKFNIKILPGVIDFSIQVETNINFMFPKKDSEFTLSIGQPLVQLIPITEKKLKIKNHLVSEHEYNRIFMNSASPSFYGWRKVLQLRRRNKERGTCPFELGDI